MFEKSKIKNIINTKISMDNGLRKAGSILEQFYLYVGDASEREPAKQMLQQLFDSICRRWSDDAALPSGDALIDYAARLVRESTDGITWEGEATGSSEARILVRATALTLMLGEKLEQSEDLAALFAVIVNVGIRVRYVNSAYPEVKTASVNQALATAAWEAYQAVRHADDGSYYHDTIFAAENDAIDAIDGDTGSYGCDWARRYGEAVFDIMTDDGSEPAPAPVLRTFTLDDLLDPLDEEGRTPSATPVRREVTAPEFDIPLRPASIKEEPAEQPSSLKIGKGFAPVPAHVSDELDFFFAPSDLSDEGALTEAAEVAEDALDAETRRSIDALFAEDDDGTANPAGAVQEKPGYDPLAFFQAVIGTIAPKNDGATEE